MKHIRLTAISLFLLTVIWIILMALSTSEIEDGWEALEYVNWAAERGTAYVMNYINVSLLTILVPVLFAFLYNFLKNLSGKWAMAGLILVPVYALMNLLVYTIQISIVPDMAAAALAQDAPVAEVARLIQADPDSLAGLINGLAYAVLGVPSIIFGRLLVRKRKIFSGWFLLLNGVLCLIGITGYLAGNTILASGILLGGVLFLFSLAAMVREFRPAASA